MNSEPSRLQCARARRARNACAAGSGRPRSRFAGRTDRTTGAGRALAEVRAPLGGPRRLLGCPCCPGPAPGSVIPASGADSGVSWRPARARVTGYPAECGDRAGPPWPWPGKRGLGRGPVSSGPGGACTAALCICRPGAGARVRGISEQCMEPRSGFLSSGSIPGSGVTRRFGVPVISVLCPPPPPQWPLRPPLGLAFGLCAPYALSSSPLPGHLFSLPGVLCPCSARPGLSLVPPPQPWASPLCLLALPASQGDLQPFCPPGAPGVRDGGSRCILTASRHSLQP